MVNSNPLVYLNGHFLPLSDAKVSVMDRGFLFGDGVYEVIPVYGGRPFRLAEHLHRLEQSLAAIHMVSPYGHDQWQRIFERLITTGPDQSIYLQITRGVAPKRDHAIPANIEPTVFALCTPIPPIPEHGVRAVVLDDIRWRWCHIKAITLLANVLLRQAAVDHHAVEAILIRDGLVTEGAASNVFAVLDGHLVTPPKSQELLPGITRDLVLELALEHRLPAIEAPLTRQDLEHATEIWLTSSTREVLPVIALDDQPVGGGQPGPLWREIRTIYQDYKARLRAL